MISVSDKVAFIICVVIFGLVYFFDSNNSDNEDDSPEDSDSFLLRSIVHNYKYKYSLRWKTIETLIFTLGICFFLFYFPLIKGKPIIVIKGASLFMKAPFHFLNR